MTSHERLHALDAVRAGALLLGVVFHAGFSFIPGIPAGIWAMVDSSPSTTLAVVLFATHMFRMTLFFLIAGFFARMAFHRRGARGFWADRGKRILVPLVVGWIVLAPTMGAVWIWGLTRTFGGTLPAPPADLPPPPAAPGEAAEVVPVVRRCARVERSRTGLGGGGLGIQPDLMSTMCSERTK